MAKIDSWAEVAIFGGEKKSESQFLQVPVIEISTDEPSGMGEQGENVSMLVENVGG